MFVSHLPTSPAAPSRRQSAFTLVELSIVLVIVGLLVGAILVGRDLIRAAELRGVMSDIEQFESARRTFKMKYNCAPGDCATATDFSLGTNGNGNGYVDWPGGGAGTAETWQFWKHLSAAGLIQGNYTGVNGPQSANRDVVIGTNVPSAHSLPDVGFFMYTPAPSYTTWTGTGLDTDGLPRALTDSMYMIGRDASTDNQMVSGFIPPTDAQILDTKYDDGLANNGTLRVGSGGTTYNTIGCTTGTAPNYVYATDNSKLCQLMYWFAN